MKNRWLIILITSIMAAASGCSFNMGTGNMASNANQTTNANQANTTANDTKASNMAATPQNTATSSKPAGDACGEPSLAGKRFIKKQTFPIDFKPFNGSCFVTFGSKEDMLDEKDVPRGSTFYIYRDGKQVFELPDAFGGQTACWIEGVSFKDLNGDGMTDVVLAGSCLAARNSYPSNAVYVNTGSGFTTNDEANANLENLKSLKEIENFVRKDVKSFF